MVSSNRVVVIPNQAQELTTNKHQHTSRVEAINKPLQLEVMVMIRVVVAVVAAAADILVVDTRQMLDVGVVGMDRVLMDKVVVVTVEEEEEAVVAEEVADRVDTIVMWVMVILEVVDSKKARNTKQIKCLYQTLHPL